MKSTRSLDGDESHSTARARLMVIVACVFANFVDGFDVLAISFTAPFIAAEFEVGPEVLGILFGAGLAGITLGSLFISPFADRLGRRRVALSCAVTMAMSMGLCPLVANVEQLVALRFVTGLGVGGILATLNTTVAEAAPPGRRNLSISFFTAAYPVGSLLGGWLSAELTSIGGWRSVFVAGALLSVIAWFMLYRWLPEAPPANEEEQAGSRGLAGLFGGGVRNITVLLSASFFIQMFVVFFVLNWTPTLVQAMGFDVQVGITSLMLVNLGSLLGGLSYGPLADRFGWKPVAAIFTGSLAVAIAAFAASAVGGGADVLRIAAMVMGFLIGGSMTCLYAMSPQLLPRSLCVTGTGFAIGVGRMGGMISPVLAGWALAIGLPPATLFMIAAILPLILTLTILALGRNDTIGRCVAGAS